MTQAATRDSATADVEDIVVDSRTPISIVGIGCRLPGGRDCPEAFYEALLEGLDAMKEVPLERWDATWLDDPRRRMGTIQGIDEFDAKFFSVPPVEASRMDPQHRILLETSVHALQDAGMRLSDVAGTRTGVFVGCSSQEYAVVQLNAGSFPEINGQTNTGVALSIASNRISYLLDLRGPSFTVDTACSSSLLAVHLAVSALRRGECTTAIVGGANALLGPGTTLGFARGGFLSPDGHCKAFDAKADGFARSEGSAMFVLKPLPAALRDGNRIYATIIGTATNEDGKSDGGMTHPSDRAQREVIQLALRDANLEPSAVQYVEAHGTGTAVGDPIEVGALGQVIGAAHEKKQPLIIGSVKTNIGHLEPASGAAGLVKLALSMAHGTIPGNLHFQTPNPSIDFEGLNVRVAVGPTPWPKSHNSQMYAGINSFGFGGANVHAVLCGAPVQIQNTQVEEDLITSKVHVLRLGARSEQSLTAIARAYTELLRQGKHSLREICRATTATRDGFEIRAAITACNTEEAIKRLEDLIAATSATSVIEGVERGRKPDERHIKVAFICSGQGPQWARMASQLMSEEPVFAKTIREIDRELAELRPGWSLLEELGRNVAETHIGDTCVAQPALMAIHIGLANLWRSRGIIARGIVGHSVGEVAAAYISGALTLKQACLVIHHRSLAQSKASGKGRMLAVGMNEAEAQKLLPSDGSVSVAAANAPSATTLSGNASALESLAKQLEKRRIFSRFLRVDTPFHSKEMEPLKDELLTALKELQPTRVHEQFELWSTVTGRREDGLHANPDHWYRNVRGTVLFERAIRGMLDAGYNTFIELSPHPALAANTNEIAKAVRASVLVVSSMRNVEGACQSAEMAKAEARLFVWGTDSMIHASASERAIRLPLYAWDRERYWEENQESSQRRRSSHTHPHIREKHASLREPANTVVDVCYDIARDHAYLRDHALNGQVVLPAAAITELALSTGKELFGERAAFVEDIHFSKALFLPAQCRVDVSSDRGCFFLYSRPAARENEQADWTLNSQGRINTLEDAFFPRHSDCTLQVLQKLCTQKVDGDGLYHSLKQAGLEFGPCFHCLRHVFVGSHGNSLARISLPAVLADDARHGFFSLHPCAMDAAIISLFAPLQWEPAMGSFLPAKLERARVLPRASKLPLRECWAHCVLLSSSAESFVADIRFLSDEGEVFAEVQGFTMRLIPGSADKHSIATVGAYHQWLWEPCGKEIKQEKPCGRILLVTDSPKEDNLISSLADAFEGCELHASCTLNTLRSFNNMSGFDAIVVAFAATQAGNESIDIETKPLLFLEICKSILSASRSKAPKVMLTLTRGAQQMDPEKLAGVSQSSLWGMTRTAATEVTPATGTKFAIVDLLQDFSQRDFDSLLMHVKSLIGGSEFIPEVLVRNGSLEKHVLNKDLQEMKKLPVSSCGGQYIVSMPAHGGTVLKALRLEHAPRRSACPPKSVVIAVHAASLNFRDVLCAAGMLPQEAIEGSCWGTKLGCECSGVVTEAGDGSRWKVGDEVIAWASNCFAGSVEADDGCVRGKPAWLSFEEAAAMPVVYITAHYALHHQCRIQKGEWLLLHSAAGGVGIAALNLARMAEVNVIATASPSKHPYLKSLGVKYVFDSGSLTWRDEVMRITGGRGVDVVLNSLAGRAITQSLRCMAPFGRFAEIAKMDIYRDSKLPLRLVAENCSYFAIDIDKMTKQKPQLTARLADEFLEILDALNKQGKLIKHELNLFPMSKVADAFATLAKGKVLGKIVVTTTQEETVLVDPCEQQMCLDPKGSYLVSGGTSGFGLATAQWLVSRGAGNVLLLSRRATAREGAQQDNEALSALLATGRARAVCCDVTNPDDVRSAVAASRENGFTLRGVFHSAAVFDDRPLGATTEESMRTVMRPKALGAWNLHEATVADSGLEHFVMFSSISSVLGNAGQTNYTAANSFLDGLAQLRVASGLPAVSVSWGPIASHGYLTRAGAGGRRVLDLLASKGLIALSTPQIVSVLNRTLREPRRAQVIASIIDWARLSQTFDAANDPRFAALAASAASAGSSQQSSTEIATSIRDACLKATQEDREKLIGQHLQRCVARVTGAPAPEKIDTSAALPRLGLDSLMTNQLQSLIFSDIGVDVPLMRLVRGPSIETLSRELSAEIQAIATTSADTPKAIPAEVPGDMWFSRANAVERPSLRLVCFPYHLGGPSAFAHWAQQLPVVAPGVELYVARVPGWESRESEPTPRSTRELVAPFVSAVSAISKQGPWAVYGHSLGAMLAFELVRAVEASGQRLPERLFVAACPSPAHFEGKRVAQAFSIQGSAFAAEALDDEVYVAPGAVGVPVTAFAPSADEVFEPELSCGWEAVAPTGRFERVEMPGCPHLFLTMAEHSDFVLAGVAARTAKERCCSPVSPGPW